MPRKKGIQTNPAAAKPRRQKQNPDTEKSK
jgi:hypothetical protein